MAELSAETGEAILKNDNGTIEDKKTEDDSLQKDELPKSENDTANSDAEKSAPNVASNVASDTGGGANGEKTGEIKEKSLNKSSNEDEPNVNSEQQKIASDSSKEPTDSTKSAATPATVQAISPESKPTEGNRDTSNASNESTDNTSTPATVEGSYTESKPLEASDIKETSNDFSKKSTENTTTVATVSSTESKPPEASDNKETSNDFSRESTDNITATATVEVSSAESKPPEVSGNQGSVETTQQQENNNPSLSNPNADNKDIEKNLGKENVEIATEAASAHDKTSTANELEGEIAKNVAGSNKIETGESNNVENVAPKEDSAKTEKPGTPVDIQNEATTNGDTTAIETEDSATKSDVQPTAENPVTQGDKPDEVATTETGDKGQDTQKATGETKEHNKEVEKPTEVNTEQGKEDTKLDKSPSITEQTVPENVSKTTTKVESEIPSEKTERDVNTSEDNGEAKEKISTGEKEKSAGENNMTEVPVNKESNTHTKEGRDVEENVATIVTVSEKGYSGDKQQSTEGSDGVTVKDVETNETQQDKQNSETDNVGPVKNGKTNESKEDQGGNIVAVKDAEIDQTKQDKQTTEGSEGVAVKDAETAQTQEDKKSTKEGDAVTVKDVETSQAQQDKQFTEGDDVVTIKGVETNQAQQDTVEKDEVTKDPDNKLEVTTKDPENQTLESKEKDNMDQIKQENSGGEKPERETKENNIELKATSDVQNSEVTQGENTNQTENIAHESTKGSVNKIIPSTSEAGPENIKSDKKSATDIEHGIAEDKGGESTSGTKEASIEITATEIKNEDGSPNLNESAADTENRTVEVDKGDENTSGTKEAGVEITATEDKNVDANPNINKTASEASKSDEQKTQDTDVSETVEKTGATEISENPEVKGKETNAETTVSGSSPKQDVVSNAANKEEEIHQIKAVENVKQTEATSEDIAVENKEDIKVPGVIKVDSSDVSQAGVKSDAKLSDTEVSAGTTGQSGANTAPDQPKDQANTSEKTVEQESKRSDVATTVGSKGKAEQVQDSMDSKDKSESTEKTVESNQESDSVKTTTQLDTQKEVASKDKTSKPEKPESSDTTVSAESKDQSDYSDSAPTSKDTNEIVSLPETEVGIGKEETSTDKPKHATEISSVQVKKAKDKQSTFGNTKELAMIGASMEIKKEVKTEPKKVKNRIEFVDVKPKDKDVSTRSQNVPQTAEMTKDVEKSKETTENQTVNGGKEEEGYVMVDHEDAKPEGSNETEVHHQDPINQSDKSDNGDFQKTDENYEEDFCEADEDRADAREEQRPGGEEAQPGNEEAQASHVAESPVATVEEVKKPPRPVVEISAEFLELMEGFCMAASQEFPSDIIDFACRYFVRIHKRRNALRKYSIEVSDLALFADVNWCGNI